MLVNILMLLPLMILLLVLFTFFITFLFTYVFGVFYNYYRHYIGYYPHMAYSNQVGPSDAATPLRLAAAATQGAARHLAPPNTSF